MGDLQIDDPKIFARPIKLSPEQLFQKREFLLQCFQKFDTKHLEAIEKKLQRCFDENELQSVSENVLEEKLVEIQDLIKKIQNLKVSKLIKLYNNLKYKIDINNLWSSKFKGQKMIVNKNRLECNTENQSCSFDKPIRPNKITNIIITVYEKQVIESSVQNSNECEDLKKMIQDLQDIPCKDNSYDINQLQKKLQMLNHEPVKSIVEGTTSSDTFVGVSSWFQHSTDYDGSCSSKEWESGFGVSADLSWYYKGGIKYKLNCDKKLVSGDSIRLEMDFTDMKNKTVCYYVNKEKKRFHQSKLPNNGNYLCWYVAVSLATKGSACIAQMI